MNAFVWIEDKWRLLCEKTAPARSFLRRFWQELKHVLHVTWSFIYRLRSVFLAIVLGFAAIWVMLWCSPRLPDSVGIYLMNNGEFFLLVPKQIALIGSLAVTATCILLMLCTKKPLYPWLIGVFSLVLPIFFLFTNIYPC